MLHFVLVFCCCFRLQQWTVAIQIKHWGKFLSGVCKLYHHVESISFTIVMDFVFRLFVRSHIRIRFWIEEEAIHLYPFTNLIMFCVYVAPKTLLKCSKEIKQQQKKSTTFDAYYVFIKILAIWGMKWVVLQSL